MARQDELAAAAELYRTNHHVVPLRLKGKSPEIMGAGWQERTLADPTPQFADDSNIGFLLGVPSGDVVRVDPDFPSVPTAAALLFPEPTLTFGRASSPHSGRLYRSKIKTTNFKLPNVMEGDARLPLHGGKPALIVLQVLSTGAQTMAPPSLHPDTGEAIVWQSTAAIQIIAVDELLRRAGLEVFLLAVTRFWPPRGTRNEAAMALARVLLEALAPQHADEARALALVDALVLAVAMVGGDGASLARR